MPRPGSGELRKRSGGAGAKKRAGKERILGSREVLPTRLVRRRDASSPAEVGSARLAVVFGADTHRSEYDGRRVELLRGGEVVREEAEVIAVSRVSSGRAIRVSQLCGDQALRVDEGGRRLAIEILDAGRRARLEVATREIIKCTTSVEVDPDRSLECGICGLRFGTENHLEAHVKFHDEVVPRVGRQSRRVRLALADTATLDWMQETAVDPTTHGSWAGAGATWEPIARYEDPLADEIRRTRVVTMRLRDDRRVPALENIASLISPSDG